MTPLVPICDTDLTGIESAAWQTVDTPSDLRRNPESVRKLWKGLDPESTVSCMRLAVFMNSTNLTKRFVQLLSLPPLRVRSFIAFKDERTSLEEEIDVFSS